MGPKKKSFAVARNLVFLLFLSGLLASCAHRKLHTDARELKRFSNKNTAGQYVLDPEVTIVLGNNKGRPIIQVDLPHSRGCQVWIDQDYPGVAYPENVANNAEKIDPTVFVLKYDSRCMKDKELSQGSHLVDTPMTSQIDIYAQVNDPKLAQFKKDFESGELKLAFCRYWDCSDLVSYQDSIIPKVIYHSEFVPQKLVDLHLGEEKQIRPDVRLIDAIYGPSISVCDGKVKQPPALTFSFFLPSLPKKNAISIQKSPTDERFIFRFYKGKIIDRAQSEEIVKKGEVFCALRVIETTSKSNAKTGVKPGEKPSADESFDFVPLQALAYNTNFGATFYEKKDKYLVGSQYFSRSFELYGNNTQQNVILSGGFCSTPHGDQASGRQVLMSDIVENIPGISITTNYPEHWVN